MNNEVDITLRLITVFRRRGLQSQHTGIINELNESAKCTVMAAADENWGAPVLASVLGPDSWCILTCKQIVWKNAAKLVQLPYADILEVKCDFSAIPCRMRDAAESVLTIVTKSSGLFEVAVEGGSAMSGIWNALIAAIKLHRKGSGVDS